MNKYDKLFSLDCDDDWVDDFPSKDESEVPALHDLTGEEIDNDDDLEIYKAAGIF